MKKLLLAGSMMTGIFLAQSAAAQDAESDAGTETAQPGGLNIITVTAQRREESLQDAPIAISALSGDAMAQGGVTSPSDLTYLVPALEIQPGGGGKSNFYLRGVGGLTGNSLTEPAVAFNFNDVYISRPQGTGGFFFDLDRVEVVKGPQGTLYGRNATGGAINVIPAAPRLGRVEGYATAGYGNYDALQLEGAINVPLGDVAAVRAAAAYNRHDGYLSDGSSDQNDLAARLSLRLEPSDTVDITIVGDYFSSRGIGTGATIISNSGGRFTIDDRVGLSDPRAQAVYQSTYIFIGGNTLTGLPADLPFNNIDNFGISATVNVETGIGDLTFIPAFRKNDSQTVNYAPGFYIAEDSGNEQFSAELRLASDDSQTVSYILGAYYFNDDGSVPDFRTNAQYNASFQEYAYGVESLAAFGRLNFRATDDLTLTVGGRYTTEDRTFQGTFNSINRLCVTQTFAFSQCPGAPIVPFGSLTVPNAFVDLSGVGVGPFPQAGGIAAYFNGFNPPRNLVQVFTPIANNSEVSFDKFTWRLGADYQINADSMVYASFETGFKSGGFFFSPASNTYQPETINAFTIGSKNSFAGNTVRLNLEAFYWEYSDQQISHLGSAIDPNTNQAVTIFPTENVGQATFAGFEIEAEALLTDTTLIGVTVQYLDANYDDFVYNVPANAPPQTGCTTTPSPSTATIALDCSGFRPPNAPEFILRMSGQQTIPFDSGADVVIDVSATYQSKTLTGLEFLPLETQPDFWIADASVTYNAPDDRFFISAYIRNAFDETVFTSSFPPPLSNGLFAANLRPPRTYGVRAGFNF